MSRTVTGMNSDDKAVARPGPSARGGSVI